VIAWRLLHSDIDSYPEFQRNTFRYCREQSRPRTEA
jgi:hypothetical protein